MEYHGQRRWQRDPHRRFLRELKTDLTGNGAAFLVSIVLGFSPRVVNGNGITLADTLRLGDIDLNGSQIQFDDASPITVVGHISGTGMGPQKFAINMTGRSVLTLNDNSYIDRTFVQTATGKLIAATSHALGASGPDNVVERSPRFSI